MTDEQKIQIRQMRSEGASYKNVADALGITSESVRSFCRRDKEEEMPVQETVNEPIESVCPTCGGILTPYPNRKAKKFCSDKCRMSWWNNHLDQVKKNAVYEKVCAYCNKPFSIYGRKDQKYCCMECYRNGRRPHNGND